MKKTITLIAVVATALAAAQTARIELIARMTGDGDGKAAWKTRGATQAELQVEGEDLMPNTGYSVLIAGQRWDVTTNGLGDFRLTRRYGRTRPNITVGMPATVVDAEGAVVLTGNFVPKR